jgi:hypothetical protein
VLSKTYDRSGLADVLTGGFVAELKFSIHQYTPNTYHYPGVLFGVLSYTHFRR